MKTKPNPAHAALLDDIWQATTRLYDAWNEFDRTCDPDRIEECIYTINAATAHYSFLLKRARQIGLVNPYPASSYRNASGVPTISGNKKFPNKNLIQTE